MGYSSVYGYMNSMIGICFLTLFFACAKDQSADQGVLEGKYLTNRLLDISCAVVPEDKLPFLQVLKSNSSEYEFVLTRFNPDRQISKYPGITLQTDTADQSLLFYRGDPAGSWKNSILADNHKLLTFSIQLADQWVYFVGVKEE